MSFVDASLNGGLPCAAAAVASAAADNLHSGPIQGRGTTTAGVACCSGTGKVLKIPQDTPSTKLDSTKTFAACFSDGQTASTTWYDSGIRVRVSKIRYIEAYDVNHKTKGTLPSHPDLTMRYVGTILNDRWISLVDQDLNGGNPCDLGTVAAANPAITNSAQSGSRAAVGNVFKVNTASLSASITFAVCYAESGGISTSLWRDTGVRLRRSKITGVAYGVDTTRFGVGFSRVTTNPNTDDNLNLAFDTIPQIANLKLEYQGNLPNNMWISLVDDSINDPDGITSVAVDGASHFTKSVGNPCAYPAEAAHTPTSTHSGAAQGKQLDGTQGGKIVTILQASASTFLDATKTFAVCYATGAGDTSDMTWTDSYIRFKISKVETVGHHSALHTTTGHLPNTGATIATELLLTYTGSLAAGDSDASILVSLVNASFNDVTTNDITTQQPCTNRAIAGHSVDSSGQYSGPLTAIDGAHQVASRTLLAPK